MNELDLPLRLSRISTRWSMLFQAQQAKGDQASAAQSALVGQYCGAVYRYLMGMVHDADVAEDLAQEFALRFLRGDFRQADPARGRFRDFVKMALRHLVADHFRKQKAQPQGVPADFPEPAGGDAPTAAADQAFVDGWRDELLAQSWAALARHEQQSGQPYHAVLRLRADRPELRSAELAAELSERLGTGFTAVAVRQLLHRARAQFGQFLIDAVARSLAEPSRAAIEEELGELGLLEYCSSALAVRR